MIAAALFLRPAPQAVLEGVQKPAPPVNPGASPADQPELTLWQAMRDVRMMILIGILTLFFFNTHAVMVHLVNFATDTGVTPLVAATILSAVGAISIVSRLVMGFGADRVGGFTAMVIIQVLMLLSFVCLIFAQSLAAFYLFAVVFGLAYGGEVPLIPLIISRLCGTKAMATVIGFCIFINNIGGALGPWVAGKIYDSTQSYHWAFVTGAIVGAVALAMAFWLRHRSRGTLQSPG